LVKFKRYSHRTGIPNTLISDIQHPWDIVCEVAYKSKICPNMAPLGSV